MKRSNNRGSLSLTTAIFICILTCLSACKSTKETPHRGAKTSTSKKQKSSDGIVKSDDIARLQKDLTGSFNNSAQDSTSSVQALHLYPIWLSNEDKYLYVEKTAIETPMTATEQQVYKLESDGKGGFITKVYNIKSPESMVGKFETPSFFDQFSTNILLENEGCSLYLRKHADGSYSGSTRLDHCKNTKNGSAYTTTTVKIRENTLMFWEKGFDESGKQLWEASLGSSRYSRMDSK